MEDLAGNRKIWREVERDGGKDLYESSWSMDMDHGPNLLCLIYDLLLLLLRPPSR